MTYNTSEGKSADWWEELTEGEKENILNGMKDFQEGNTMNSKKFWNALKIR